MMLRNGFRVFCALLAWPLLAGLAAADPCPTGPECKEVCKKVCVPTTETVKKVTPVYSMKCEDRCLVKCSHCMHGRCGECAQCGKPREVRQLVKKFKVEEECKVKCQLEHRVELVPVKCKERRCKESSCCPDSCGATIIMDGTGPAMTIPGAEPLAPPKNLE